MNILLIAFIVFIFLELSNVFILYFAPGSRRGNGMGVFKAYEKSKKDPEVHALVAYLINWIAGTKLIFIVLLTGIIITGNSATRVFSGIALIFSILTFYLRLYPAIRQMDEEGQISPKGYSKALGIMIAVIIVIFAAALAVSLIHVKN